MSEDMLDVAMRELRRFDRLAEADALAQLKRERDELREAAAPALVELVLMAELTVPSVERKEIEAIANRLRAALSPKGGMGSEEVK